ncbi:MAG: cell division protein FtsL [Tissierellia bacterium]|nr:cell division protein FtsL [Tissierellia bacterium]
MGMAQRKYIEDYNVKPKVVHKNIKVVRKNNNKYILNKKKAKKKKNFRILCYVITSGLLVASLIVSLIGYTNLNQMNKEILKMKKEVSELEANRDYLLMQLEPYKSTQRVEDIARISLGMDYPTQDQLLYLESEEDTKLAEKNKDENKDLVSSSKK